MLSLLGALPVRVVVIGEIKVLLARCRVVFFGKLRSVAKLGKGRKPAVIGAEKALVRGKNIISVLFDIEYQPMPIVTADPNAVDQSLIQGMDRNGVAPLP